MGEKSYPITVEQFQEGMNCCVHVWTTTYIYTILKKIITISPPMHWIDSVCRQMLFMMSKRRMKNLLPSGGFRNASGRSFSNEAGHQAFS